MTGERRTLAELGLAAPDPGLRVAGIAADSRQVAPGFLFAALPGSREHGARYAAAALERGAVAILTDAAGAAIAQETLATRPAAPAALVIAADPRAALALAAARWFGVQPRVVAAVTGTNGKTSVAAFTRQIWAALGHAAISLGTTGVEGAWSGGSSHTTPDPLTLHRLLAEAASAGVTHAAMEASSHGLDQRRLDGVRLAAAGFTNLSQDHLDYHGTMAAYRAAKETLFTRVLPEGAPAVVCIETAEGRALADRLRPARPVLTVGAHPEAELAIDRRLFHEDGQTVTFVWNRRGDGPAAAVRRSVRLALVGGFQAANVAVAAGLAEAADGSAGPAAVLDVLDRLTGVRGRMQLAARRANGAAVYVDYAHTPDAIVTALAALRHHVAGRIVAVIGAGGDRDRTKRPLMGAAAAAGADAVLVTDDNPRSEDPALIRAAVLAGCPLATEIGDRAEAILRAAAMLGPGDALLICGKGHETGQEIAGTLYPFDDAEQASLAVAALDGVRP
jgi:UDP-N-acetylmuramoyl-L-alanyl-D-glutamate--2,6-diaminopimelate ligase